MYNYSNNNFISNVRKGSLVTIKIVVVKYKNTSGRKCTEGEKGVAALLNYSGRLAIPVSYTHLDVYKRQSINCGNCLVSVYRLTNNALFHLSLIHI